jgi:hypothetical protein
MARRHLLLLLPLLALASSVAVAAAEVPNSLILS